MSLPIEVEWEDDGRWLAEVPELPGVLAYGPIQEAAAAGALADRLQHGEELPSTLAGRA